MSRTTDQFITRMKLAELNRQRDLLRAAYRDVAAAAVGAPDPAARLRALYDGLRGVTFAGRPLHPAVANLDPVLAEADTGVISPAVFDLWLGRLDAELAAGRLRAEFVHLFGALLDEWAQAGGPAPAAGADAERDRLVAIALADPPPTRAAEVLGPLFASLGETANDLAGKVRAEAAGVRAAVEDYELQGVLTALSNDGDQAPPLRREAAALLKDDVARKDLRDALSILMADLDGWDWPADGVPVEAVWTRNKWRLFLRPDLPTAALLAVLGERWADLFDRAVGDRTAADQRRRRLKKLLELNAPEVIVRNERRMLKEKEGQADLGYDEPADPWAEPGRDEAAEVEGGSIAVTRAVRQLELRRFPAAAGDGYDPYGGANRLVQTVHAEVRALRAAFPDRPLYVLKLDVKDCYPSLPHDGLLFLLRSLGVPDADLAFFGKFLAPPLRVGGAPLGKARRGVPLRFGLSGMLAELFLRLLERHVHAGATVRVLRLVDDVCVLSPTADGVVAALARVNDFCAACGLGVNADKTGAVAVGGGLPPGLPTALPRWGMLELDAAGDWRVHRPTLDAHLQQARDRVAAAGAVLAKVQEYNANARYLLNAVGVAGHLGDAHRAAVADAVRRFHLRFFDDTTGVVAGLAADLGRRFGADPAAVPEGWVYWPLTAGGLGLVNPLLTVSQYAQEFHNRTAVERPTQRGPDWQTTAGGWFELYSDALETVAEAYPDETPVMKTLVDDFVARGQEVSAGAQAGLTAYWRWVLAVYGPEVLARFGTFRFLLTELVPLKLIGRQLGRPTAADGQLPAVPF